MDLPNTPSEFCHGSFWSRGSTWVFQKTRPPSIPEFWNCLWTTCITRWYLNVDPNFKKINLSNQKCLNYFGFRLGFFCHQKNPAHNLCRDTWVTWLCFFLFPRIFPWPPALFRAARGLALAPVVRGWVLEGLSWRSGRKFRKNFAKG